MELTYKELIDIAKHGLHTHVNAQDGTDYCKICKEHLLHAAHHGMEYFKEKTEHFKCMMD